MIKAKAMLPGQRTEEIDVYKPLSTIEACLNQAQYDLAPLDQGPVYALMGNANTPNLLERIDEVKGEERGMRPVGWIAPFSHTLDAMDVSHVTDPKLKELVSNPDILTRRLGGIAFLRGPADMNIKDKRAIPDCIIPNLPDAEVQLFSTTGNEFAHVLVRMALRRGIEPIMTSCNISGQDEIVTEREAREFAREHLGPEVAVHVVRPDSEKPLKPRGSYPVLRLESDHLQIVRNGCFSEAFLRALLSDVKVELAPKGVFKPSAYPDKNFDLSDLLVGQPEDFEMPEQEDLRIATLQALHLRRQ